MIRLADKVVERLQEQAKRYGENEEQRFIDEIGWEDWMNDFTEDSEDMTENELRVIDDILTQIFESVR